MFQLVMMLLKAVADDGVGLRISRSRRREACPARKNATRGWRIDQRVDRAVVTRPAAFRGGASGKARNGIRVPSGRSATARPPTKLSLPPSRKATAIGHSSCGNGWAVRPIELPRSAPLALAQFRAAAPQLDSGFVVKGDASGGVGRVDGCRQRLDQALQSRRR